MPFDIDAKDVMRYRQSTSIRIPSTIFFALWVVTSAATLSILNRADNRLHHQFKTNRPCWFSKHYQHPQMLACTTFRARSHRSSHLRSQIAPAIGAGTVPYSTHHRYHLQHPSKRPDSRQVGRTFRSLEHVQRWSGDGDCLY